MPKYYSGHADLLLPETLWGSGTEIRMEGIEQTIQAGKECVLLEPFFSSVCTLTKLVQWFIFAFYVFKHKNMFN